MICQSQALLKFFKDHNHDVALLHQAVELLQNAVLMSSGGDGNHQISQELLAAALITRFERLGDRSDLDTAINLRRSLLETYPPGDEGRFCAFIRLFADLSTRYEKYDEQSDLEDALSAVRSAMALRPQNEGLSTMEQRLQQELDLKNQCE